MVVRFFDLGTETAKKIANVRATTQGGLTLLIDTSYFASDSTAINLLLNAQDTTVTFFFDSVNSADGFGTADFELQMVYDKEYTIFDPQCDPSVSFFNLDTARSTFDSTVIVGRATDLQLTSNIDVFF